MDELLIIFVLAAFIGYFAEFLIVYLTRVRRRARNYQLRSISSAFLRTSS